MTAPFSYPVESEAISTLGLLFGELVSRRRRFDVETSEHEPYGNHPDVLTRVVLDYATEDDVRFLLDWANESEARSVGFPTLERQAVAVMLRWHSTEDPQ